jgi:hypothetical protein
MILTLQRMDIHFIHYMFNGFIANIAMAKMAEWVRKLQH